MPENHHRVRLHHWRDGILVVNDYWFEEMDNALDFTNNSNAHSAKIYNPEGDIIHSSSPASNSTYA